MRDKYAKYIGKIVQIHGKKQNENTADLVARVTGTDSIFLGLGHNTYFYDDDSNSKVIARIKIAEMGYNVMHVNNNPWSYLKGNIENIKILARK